MKQEANNIEKIYPLTPMQEGMLFHEIKDDSEAYFNQLYYTVNGSFDSDIFAESIRILGERHDILRSAFVYDKTERPIQVVLRNRSIPCTILDKRNESEEAYERFLTAYKEADLDKGFDLIKEPLLRITVIQKETAAFDFLWSYHHILLDGWCHAILVEELNEIYNSLKENRPLQLAPAVSFGTYVKWLEQQDQQASKAYWKNYLDGYQHLAEIPSVPSTEELNDRNPLKKLVFDTEKTAILNEVVKEMGVTLNDLFQAAWGLLLAKYSGSNDVVYGNVVSGRPATLEGMDRCLGLFINTIPVRVQFSDGDSLRTIVQKTHTDFINGLPHHYSSLADIQSETALKADLVNHVIAFENYPLSEMNEEEAGDDLFQISNVAVFDRTNYDFDIDVELAKEITVTFYYHPEKYHPAFMDSLLASFEELVHQFAHCPDRRVNEIQWLAAKEEKQLLFDFNATAVDFTNTQPIHEVFEAVVKTAPEVVAIKHGSREWTYKSLNEYANQLANSLRLNGLSKGSFVGVHLERTPELIAALLAVFKAGGVYVPLDIQNPVSRTLELLTDGDISAVITDNTLAGALCSEALPKTLGQCIVIDKADTELSVSLGKQGVLLSDGVAIKEAALVDVKGNTEVSDWAYMLYTSGSTGKPKGAITRHDGALNHIYAEYAALDLKDGFSFLQSASIASDISVWQMLAPLLKKGTVVIADKAWVLDYEKTFQILRDEAVSIAEFVPSYLIGFVEFLKEKATTNSLLPALEWMMMVGEEIPAHLVNDWRRLVPNCRVLNGYGPCEASDDITQYEITEAIPSNEFKVPIGKPIANMNIFILDNNEKLVPIGVSGEICVSGIGVGAGYYKEPEKTAESFKENPFLGTLGNSMYKTGDLGRWLPDGNIEFLGRKDRQVKIRGNRVELGEIEALLRSHKHIANAAVIAHKKSPNDIDLIAFIVLEDAVTTKFSDIEQQLSALCKEALPSYMRPNHYCQVVKLPQNLSDKVDEKKLLAHYFEVHKGQKEGVEAGVPCSTPTELVVKAIWEHVLQKSGIGAADDFFEKGGHSLLAMRVKAAVLKQLKVNLDVRDLFVYTQLQALAAHIDATFQGAKITEQLKQVRPTKIPLSYAQESVWFLDQLHGGSAEYHIPAAVRLTGKLDVTVLEAALKEVVDRHEILRSVIDTSEEEPHLQFLDAQNWELVLTDKTQATTTVKEDIYAASKRPIVLTKDFKLRAELFRYSSEEHVLVLVMHHIAADGWSESILVEEFLSAYQAKLQGKEAVLPELPVQYVDYILWQRKKNNSLEEQLSYWEKKLAGVEILEFPTDFKRPETLSTRGATVSFTIAEEETNAMRALAQAQKGTLFMSLLSAFNLLLYRYAGQGDICVGTPIAGRTHQEFEGLIGFFVNTLAIRTELRADMSFQELLAQVRATALEAFKYQDTPFEKVVERTTGKRDINRNPLYQVMFTYQNTPEVADLQLNGLTSELLEPSELQVHSDLHMIVEESGSELQVEIEYRKDLFETATIERLATHFSNLVKAVVTYPEKELASLAMLSPAEEAQLLSFNAANLELDSEETILDLFNQQVQRKPEALALIAPNNTMSYGELNSKAESLAADLQGLGVRRGDFVPICMERGIPTVVGIFAILKLGAAYVPIDPSNPKDRILFIVDDCNAKTVLTQPDVLATVQGTSEVRWVDTLALLNNSKEASVFQAPEIISQSDTAYSIYTSGTTGRPKGAVISHRALYSFVCFSDQTHPLKEGDRMTFKTNFGFDMAIPEIFGWIKGGASMVIVPDATVRDLGQFINELNRQQVTQLNLVPSHLTAFMEYVLANDIEMPSIEYFLIGGEVLPVRTVRNYQKSKLTASLDNIYGPTETTVFCNYYRASELPANAVTVPIGKPTPNAAIYILDDHLNLLPVGVVGELCIGGTGLGKGYLNRPDLTAAKFVANPFVTGQRLYKTGDLAKWLPDGNVSYIGRKDSQVKVNGYRIELGEIETVLNQCQQVKLGVVIAKELPGGGKQLQAFVQGETREVQLDQISAELGEKLPEYMVPKQLVVLEEFPLNRNGKIDRNELAKWKAVEEDTTTQTASTVLEKKLLTIWSELLNRPVIGIHENFFEIGGHSILAMRMIAKIQKQLGSIVDLATVFKNATIQGLAEAIEKGQAMDGSTQVAISKVEEAELYPCSQAQKRLWLAQQIAENKAVYNIVVGFEIQGEFDLAKFEKTLSYVLNKHEILRTNFIDKEGIPYQKIKNQINSTDFFEVLHTEKEVLEMAQQKLVSERAYEFDVSSDALLRVTVITSGSQQALIVNMHHIIGDGWSLQVLQKEIETAYESLLIQGSIPARQLTIQYKDFASWHNKRLADASNEEAQYWGRVLTGVANRKELPLDKPREAYRDTHSVVKTVAFGTELSSAITAYSTSTGHRPYLVLQTLLKAYLGTFLNTTDVPLGTLVAGRNHPQLEDQIGFYVNIIVLRSVWEVAQSFSSLLTQVAEETEAAFIRQSHPYDLLVQQLGLAGQTQKNALFDIMFAYNDGLEEEALTHRLSFQEIATDLTDEEHNKYDLMFEFQSDAQGEFTLQIKYLSSLFYKSSIAEIATGIQQFFGALLAQPDASMANLVTKPVAEVDLVDDFS